MPVLLQLAQSYQNPDSVNYKIAYLREQMEHQLLNLGDLAYEDQVQLAMLGDTIIIGGFLRTELIKAKSIVSNHLNIDDYVKLEGTGLKIEDESGFLRAHHGQPAPGQFGSRWNHADGSYTQASADGLLRYHGDTKLQYQYRTHIGNASVDGSSFNFDGVWITLPEDFQGKNFNVVVALKGMECNIEGFVTRVNLWGPSVDRIGGKFHVTGSVYVKKGRHVNVSAYNVCGQLTGFTLLETDSYTFSDATIYITYIATY